MSDRFDSKGKLHIPIQLSNRIKIPKDKVRLHEEKYIIQEAYCANGHSLMSDLKIDGHYGINLIFTDLNSEKESLVTFSSVIGEKKVVVSKGDDFKEGEIVKALCPVCRVELEVLFDCECGAHVYAFYLDKHLDKNYGQSFCARIGCARSSRLRYSKEALYDFLKDHVL